MTREELLELAALDALGLLDEYEAALYTRSFHHAPAAIQDELRALQSEVASDPSLLPDVHPPSELRERVLRAVARAIESESQQLAPLAMIGPGRMERREMSARSGLGTGGQVWRAAAFVLAGVLVVTLYFFGQRTEPNARVLEIARDLLHQHQIESVLARELREDIVGLDLGEFLNDHRAPRRMLLPAEEGLTGCAFVYVDEGSGEALLITWGLPSRRPYTLEARDPATGTVVRKAFDPLSEIGAARLGRISPTVLAGMTITIATSSGEIILAS